MDSIALIDKNFAVKPDFDTSGLTIYEVTKAPFSIYGLILPQNNADKFRRMPIEDAERVSDNVHFLSSRTAGGRLKFKTNSKRIAIFAKMGVISRLSCFALTGSAGFDLYVNNEFQGIFLPPNDMVDGYNSLLKLEDDSEKEITIHFPLYSEVISLMIGLDMDATVSKSGDYAITNPVVYYGSSITQGGCASRPGNSYEAMIARRFGINYLNLGFAGSALGEKEMAEYISKLDMSAFVLDYDYNAPNIEHLNNTHLPFYQVVREKNPTLPIVIISRPCTRLNEENRKRMEIIATTYRFAKANGDENVYFINGYEMMSRCGHDATIDGTHPNDLGFDCMANTIGEFLSTILK